MSEIGSGAERNGAMPGGGVLRRLLAARLAAEEDACRPPQLPQPAPPTPAKAAAIAIGRAADRLYGLQVQPTAIAPGALSLAELPELLPDPALLAVLEGPGEALGVMALSPETVTALIEVQALGRITGRPAERRRPTRSDAMLCADFVNALMAEIAQELDGIDGFEGWAGYRYASYLDDPRPLALMLDDRPFRSIAMDLRLGGPQGREARILIALPQPGPSGRPAHAPAPAARPAAPTADPAPVPAEPLPRPTLAANVREAPVELVGILCRRRISLGELRALAPGRILALPRVSLADTRLETPSGQVLAHGKLGEADGCHAIRLQGPDTGSQPQDDPAPPGEGRPYRHHLPIEDLARPDPFRAPPDATDTPAPEPDLRSLPE